MRTPIVLLVSLNFAFLGLGACAQGEADDASVGAEFAAPEVTAGAFADREVQRVHDRMMDAMDPERAFDRNRYLAFTWLVQPAGGEPVARSHRWDRWSGEARVESPTDDGTLVALFNVNDPQAGRVWLDGVEVTDETRDEWLGRAHGMHINDGYWLMMPFKWTDPGVITRHLGEETDDQDRSWEVVELSFESVGRTPQNVYRAYINPTSGLMERWAHFRTADAEPFYSDWTEWRDFGGIKLPVDRPWADGGRIYFEAIDLRADVPAEAFADPSV